MESNIKSKSRRTTSERSPLGTDDLSHEASENNQQPLENLSKKKLSLTFSLKLWVIVFTGMYFIYHLYVSGKDKDQKLINYENLIMPGRNFTFQIILHDLTEKEDTQVFSEKEIIYDSSLFYPTRISSNFTVLSRRLHRRYDRYRIEAIVTFNSTSDYSKKVINCFCELGKKDMKSDDNIAIIDDPESNSTDSHLSAEFISTRFNFQLVYDQATYDFTEGSFVNYIYERKPELIPAAVLQSASKIENEYYLPRLDCSQFMSLERDKLNFSNLPEDEEVRIDFDFHIVEVQKYVLGLKLRFAEFQLAAFPIAKIFIEEIKEFFSDNKSAYIAIFFCFIFINLIFDIICSISGWQSFLKQNEINNSKMANYSHLVFNLIIIVNLIHYRSSEILISILIIQIVLKSLRIFSITRYGQIIEKRENKDFNIYLESLMISIGAIYFLYFYLTDPPLCICSLSLQSLALYAHLKIAMMTLLADFRTNKLHNVSRTPFFGWVYEITAAISSILFVLSVRAPLVHLVGCSINTASFVWFVSHRMFGRTNKDLKLV
jgi:hypothetical protein